MANPEPFRVPRDGSIFTQQVIGRCEDLITCGIWEGLDLIRFRNWMQNFQGENELYFAACILDGLVYRPDNQTVALMRHLFQRTLPDLLRSDPTPRGSYCNWFELLSQQDWNEPNIRLVPVIREGHPPTKSGPLIARMYHRFLKLNSSWMMWPWQVHTIRAKDIQTILFVDDFLGTGDQFAHFTETFEYLKNARGVYAVYAPLVAHTTGLKRMREQYPWIRCCSVETLDESYGLFHHESRCFRDEANTIESCLQYYESFYRAKDLHHYYPITRALGHGNLGLAYAFQHAIPDNCLPLLWLHTPTWQPLFLR
jgi:hypothetical protein